MKKQLNAPRLGQLIIADEVEMAFRRITGFQG